MVTNAVSPERMFVLSNRLKIGHGLLYFGSHSNSQMLTYPQDNLFNRCNLLEALCHRAIHDNLGGSTVTADPMLDQLYNLQMLEAACHKLPQPKHSERQGVISL